MTSKEMARLQRRIDETTKSIAEVRELLAVENEDLKQLDEGMHRDLVLIHVFIHLISIDKECH